MKLNFFDPILKGNKLLFFLFPMMLQAQFKPTTYCNPMNISYQFSINPLAYKDYSWGAKMPGRDMKKGEYDSFREAADPTMVVFKNEYYLFASKSGGYWVSKDLMKWDFITTNDLPLEAYAPTAVVIGDSMYFATTDCKWIYKTDNPKSGKWTIANESNPFPLDIWPKGFQDLCLFLDDDQRLYLYYGCVRPTMGVELDVKNGFKTIGELKEIHGPSTKYAWNNISPKRTDMLVEGPWMTKYKGKYYLQYATFSDSYVDGVCVSDNPLSGFEVAQSNPFSEKAKGFVTGIGHGSTFADNFSNYWHVTCVHSPIIKHNFERRLGMFPAGFDKDGVLFCDSYFGDYPHFIPAKEVNNSKSLFTGWVLLSYNKPTETSSSMVDFKAEKAVDENLRTYWSAETANKGEWFSVDLLQPLTIKAVQINFAEHLGKAKGRADLGGFQYLVEYSNDKLKWDVLVDKSSAKEDLSHDYVEIEKPVKARYIRITNIHVPDGMFALYDFRVFGNGGKKMNQQVKDFTIVRDSVNANKVKLNWTKIPSAIGYNIRYGVAKDKMYMNRMVYSDASLNINDLNGKSKYYFSIDVFNEAGVEKGKQIYELK